MRKFFEEVVLLSQAFVMNPDMTVEAALKDAEKSIGAPAKITGFVRFALGEGVEKRNLILLQRLRQQQKASYCKLLIRDLKSSLF